MRFKSPMAPFNRLLRARVRPILLSLVTLSCAPEREAAAPVAPLSPEASLAGNIGTLATGGPASALAVEADDARLGDPDAAVTIVAFLDFECAFCAQGFQTLMALRDDYKDSELRIVFKHLPLEFHEFALPGAVAGQAVMQGAGSEAFFKFARLAFSHQARLGYGQLADWAEEAGLKRDAYNDLVGQERTVRRVAQDAQLARRVGVDGTPAFYVNGRVIPGAQPIEYFRQVIGEELAAIKKRPERSWKAAYQARVSENMRGSLLEALLAHDPEDYLLPVDGSATAGRADAPVTIVMFTDFECPFCKRAEVTLGLLKNKYGDKLRFVFKHMPLGFHKSARPASLLAEAIHVHQGDAAFFSAVDALFRSNPDLSTRALEKIGRDHGLSPEQIATALADTDPTLSARLQRDSDLGDDVLAQGTPHFFVNGKRLSGARPVEQFEALIDHGLRRAEELREEGTPPAGLYAAMQEGALSPGVPTRLDAVIPSTGSPTKGPNDAPISIHVFSDFECPYCRNGEQLLVELNELFPGKIRLIWHDFPLDFHDRARPSARAAREAFAQQGNEGFWKMHGRLFALDHESPALSVPEILVHAKEIGLDVTKVESALTSTEHDDAIDRDVELGAELGIRGTPAYVVDGYLISGAKPLRDFQRLIERSLSTPTAARPADE